MKRMRLVLIILSGVSSLAVLNGAQTPLARPVFADGQAQIVPAFQDPQSWIRQTLWVETEFDSDNDGKRDRVFVDVTRQKQTDTEGLHVPVIYESSPYYSGTSGPREFLWNVKQEVGAVPPPRIDQPAILFKPVKTAVSERNGLADTWVPRGFAVVRSEAPGTGLSQGCVTVGGSPEELAPKAVIDWLNGRAKGFSKIDGTVADVEAKWSTGKVGMTGTSYNGTIPVAAATTGVKGLEAIIPVAPNTSYYHYYRSNGLVRHPGGWLGEDIDFLYDYVNSGDPARRDKCNAMVRDGLFVKGRDRQHGDYNNFWADRDLLTKVAGIKAAVLMAHAFNDWNVVPEHDSRIAMAIKGRVPLQFYYHQGGHGGNPPLTMMNRWFTRYLYGINNNVEKDPKAMIVREGSGQTSGALTPYADYPNPEARPVTLRLSSGGVKSGGLAIEPKPKQGKETLVDNVEFSGAALAKVESSPNRLIYATPELAQPVHLSGFSFITIRMASSKPAANLSVWLVQLPWTDGPIGTANLITRGWADPQNWKSLTGEGDYHSKAAGTPLKPGEFVTLTFMLQPDDQIIPAGKRIGLMIMSSDRDFTLWPSPGTELTVDLDNTSIELPIVGGVEKLRASFSSTPSAVKPAETTYDVHAVRFASAAYGVKNLVAGVTDDRSIDIAFTVWVLRGGGKTVLVDAGFYRDKFIQQWKPKNFVKPSEALTTALGIKPEDVTDIIVSHSHWDHMDGVDLFPKALVHIQKAEYEYYIGPSGEVLHRGGADADDAKMMAALGRVKLVDGDAQEILPGITVYTGGKHTFASQYVGVNTRSGKVIVASDNAYLYENLEKHLAIAQTVDIAARASNLDAQTRMLKLAASPSLVVPGHDPAVFTRFPTPGNGVARIDR